GDLERVSVVSRDDAVALRMALMVRYEDDEIPLLVTIVDSTAAAQLCQADPHVEITSMAAIVAPSLAGPCLAEDLAAVREGPDGPVAVRTDGERTREEPLVPPDRGSRVLTLLGSLARPYDKSAALLVYGLLGLLAVLVAETIGAVIVLDQGVIDALYGATKTLVTVDPNDGVAKGPPGFKLFTTLAMLSALFFEALFTAGIVNRLIDTRLTGWVGRRSVPRRNHVVVVGLGKVGLRLCELLRGVGVRVVAVDNQDGGENVGIARQAGIPVIIGRGADPSLLRRLSLDSACALAAVTSDDLQNLSIAMSARSLNPDLRIVLRAGDGRLANETRSLLRFGVVRDVHQIAAVLLAARSTGSPARSVLCHQDAAHLVHEDGRLERGAVLGTDAPSEH
ncbi:MAG: NAD-binding protein, partial [Actinomycetota bacterium]|nr:NAD-binding protein [Actinomycetota bacterium]